MYFQVNKTEKNLIDHKGIYYFDPNLSFAANGLLSVILNHSASNLIDMEDILPLSSDSRIAQYKALHELYKADYITYVFPKIDNVVDITQIKNTTAPMRLNTPEKSESFNEY